MIIEPYFGVRINKVSDLTKRQKRVYRWYMNHFKGKTITVEDVRSAGFGEKILIECQTSHWPLQEWMDFERLVVKNCNK